jgi:hypothetical protein
MSPEHIKPGLPEMRLEQKLQSPLTQLKVRSFGLPHVAGSHL